MLPVLADAGDAQLLLRDVQEAGSQEPARQETLHVDGGQARVLTRRGTKPLTLHVDQRVPLM